MVTTNRHNSDLLTPRILVVDDERQIHASLRLRLGPAYDLVFCFNAKEALKALANERFDLCLADIHMPQMDGLAFIAAAEKIDPDLGFVILSAFDSDENLRRAIPLQVYEFLGKPMPDRDGFEAQIPGWIERTRRQRHEHALATRAGTISDDLHSALLEREVELVASESARDALLQTASLLTTIYAHLVSATSLLAPRAKADGSIAHLFRSLEEARKTADAAVNVAEGFFNSGYGNRDSSPALVGTGIRHAVSIAGRMAHADIANKSIDCSGLDDQLPVWGMTGIDFLLMMVPATAAALTVAAPNSTVRVSGEHLARLDAAAGHSRLKNCLWLNRRNALGSQPGILITVAAVATPWSRTQAEAWLRGENPALSAVTARGLVAGVQKCQGLLGLAVSPAAEQFFLALALPT
ncbi:MAG: response regulator [Opitutus sp.]|nr:response regulator [Opitutus sp.]